MFKKCISNLVLGISAIFKNIHKIKAKYWVISVIYKNNGGWINDFYKELNLEEKKN